MTPTNLLKCNTALIPLPLFFLSSDAAYSHPPFSLVNTGPSTAMQCGGPQPGAGGHVHLPAPTPPAQGNCPLPSSQHTHVKSFWSWQIVALHMSVNVLASVKRCFSPGLGSSLRFQMVTGLQSLCRAAAVDLRATLPQHHCPPLPCPPRQAPLLLSLLSHPTLKMHCWIYTKVTF